MIMGYPVEKITHLNNSVFTVAKIQKITGMQVVYIDIVSPAGELGEITLHPFNKEANNIKLWADKQVIDIALIKFKAAVWVENGQVMITGSATDQQGGNTVTFQKSIAHWLDY